MRQLAYMCLLVTLLSGCSNIKEDELREPESVRQFGNTDYDGKRLYLDTKTMARRLNLSEAGISKAIELSRRKPAAYVVRLREDGRYDSPAALWSKEAAKAIAKELEFVEFRVWALEHPGNSNLPRPPEQELTPTNLRNLLTPEAIPTAPAPMPEPDHL